jgi:type IV secretion system protein VirB6
VFATFGDQFDLILQTYATTVAANFMNYGVPVLGAAVTIWVLLSGYALLTGQADGNAAAWAWRAGKVVLITALIGSSAYYTSSLIPWVDKEIYELAKVMIPAAPGGGSPVPMSESPWALIDAVDVTFQKFGAAIQAEAQPGGWMFHLDLIAAWLLVALFVAIMEFVCAYVVLVAKMGEALYLAVGPLFIALAMFPATVRFFWSWVSCLASAVATMMVAFFLVGLVIWFGNAALSSTLASTGFLNSSVNLFGQAVGLVGVLFLLAVIAWQAPALGGALTGGPAMQQGGGLVKDMLLWTRTRAGGAAAGQGQGAGAISRGGGLAQAAGRYAGRGASAAASGVRAAYQRAAAFARGR